MPDLKQQSSVTCNMPLLSLPTELILDILEELCVPFFREDFGRLAFCKRWCTLAHPILYKDVDLTKRGLKKFLFSPGKEARFQMLKDNLRILHLRLRGHTYGTIPVYGVRVPIRSGNITRHVEQVDIKCAHKLDKRLNELADILQDCRLLTEFYFRGVEKNHDSNTCFYNRTMCRLITAQNLVVLELDIPTTFLIVDRHKLPDPDSHLCAIIKKLLTTPTLRRLSLRMNCVCCGTFAPLHGITTIYLNDLLLGFCGGDAFMFGSPGACIGSVDDFGRPAPELPETLQRKLEDDLRDLVPLMMSPKSVKMLTIATRSTIKSLDVVTDGQKDLPFLSTHR